MLDWQMVPESHPQEHLGPQWVRSSFLGHKLVLHSQEYKCKYLLLKVVRVHILSSFLQIASLDLEISSGAADDLWTT